MLSKTQTRATAVVVAVFTLSCARLTPWRQERIGNEVNLAFTLERNLVELQTVRLDNRTGRFVLATAAARTAVDPRFARDARTTLQMGEKNTVRVSPVSLNLGGVADAIIGADAFRRHAITIDYRAGLVTLQTDPIETSQMALYRYSGEPAVRVTIDGSDVDAIVDTSSPDTLVLPGASDRRGTATVRIAGADFGRTDVRYARVAQARIGNRLLSRFLVTIDYGRHVIGLWRDPRIPA